VLDDEVRHLRRDLGGPAQPQVGGQALLERDQPLLFEAGAQPVAHLGGHHTGHGRAAPQRQSLVQVIARGSQIGGGAGLGDQATEPVHVDVLAVDVEHVAGALSIDRGTRVGQEDLA
jgi:hypothetical protein